MKVPHLNETLRTLRARLLAECTDAGCWRGELSTSALATATAVTALSLAGREGDRQLMTGGLEWLVENQNTDGGWGDTPESPSNLSTTVLSWAAFAAAGREENRAADKARAWLERKIGDTQPATLADAIVASYGRDRTFSAPILAMAALTGRLGEGSNAWRRVPALPFELGVLSHRWLARLRLPVVSYALPALIAIGRLRHHHLRPLNPLSRLIRRIAEPTVLRKLEHIQPESGGFLEAQPLTAFVVMSLVASDAGDHPAVARGLRFLRDTVRPDGGWPIDTDLSAWLTSLSVRALSAGGDFPPDFSPADRRTTRDWLLACRHRRPHPYTQAPPGGWAWTDRSGGVPDADDTAAAMVALRLLDGGNPSCAEAADSAAAWLAGLQNRDGGIPTFCRGWGRLPFDRSAADLTAHAVAAWTAWPDLRTAGEANLQAALSYLAGNQRGDGAWLPLWFGNQHTTGQANPVYGTARVLTGLCSAADAGWDVSAMLRRGSDWLASDQRPDGGFGADTAGPTSLEETAVAVSALSAVAKRSNERPRLREAAMRGAQWIVEHTDGGRTTPAAPIGLYFARLWYCEKLYPLIFSVDALSRIAAVTAAGNDS
ncbi:MAG: prenyltransferase/squalene oxidase repeat-containing protein [Phycisphaerae bacterium]